MGGAHHTSPEAIGIFSNSRNPAASSSARWCACCSNSSGLDSLLVVPGQNPCAESPEGSLRSPNPRPLLTSTTVPQFAVDSCHSSACTLQTVGGDRPKTLGCRWCSTTTPVFVDCLVSYSFPWCPRHNLQRQNHNLVFFPHHIAFAGLLCLRRSTS